MANSKLLTASNIRYLLAMKELEKSSKGLRCVDIAAALGLSKPSVHNMLDIFIEMGIINKDFYGVASFTEYGNEIALKYSEYYKSLSALLKQIFPDLNNIENATCALLAEIDENALEKFNDA